ncbi:MAG: tetratricopeptide repeat protein [Ignavibacteriae bacterium]|nr:tetratricopeptide repeat protein [Ignavibacteriota bacterium]
MKRTAPAFLLLLVLQAGNAQTIDAARAELEQGRPSQARVILESVLQSDAKNAEAYYWMGWTFLRAEKRDFDEAIESMERAVELGPLNAEYHYGLGVALGLTAMEANPFTQAWLAPQIKSAFQKSVELDPKHINARGALADFYQIAPGILGGSDEKAWEQVEAILALDEFSGRAKRAQLLYRDERVDEAEHELQTLTERLPGNWRGWKTLGYFYIRVERPAQSVASFEKYVELRPDTTDSYDSLAEGLLKAKQYDRAIAVLQKAISIDSNFLSSIYKLAQAYELKGLQKEAKDEYLKATTLETNTEKRTEIEKKIRDLQ